jgi:hypothetical protein
LLVLFAATFLAVGLTLRFFENRMLYYPEPLPEGYLSELAGGLAESAWDEVAIATEDGETISGWYGRPDEPRAHLLWFHGNAGNVSHRWFDLRRFVTDERLAVLIIDYRGYGRSTGRPHEAGLYLDARAAWDWLVARGVPEREIVVLGRSIGGSVATELATARPVPALILESTFLSIGEMAKAVFPWFPASWFAKSDFPTDGRIGALDIPILLFHGESDEIVPFSHGTRLAGLAKPGRLTFVPVPGAGHNDLGAFLGDDYFLRVSRFIDAAVPGSGDLGRDNDRSE